MSASDVGRWDSVFAATKDKPAALSGGRAKEKWTSLGLEGAVLAQVWALANERVPGELDVYEHRVAMYLIDLVRSGAAVPAAVPPHIKDLCHTAATPAAASPDDVWTITPEDAALYRKMFASADVAGAGSVAASGSQLNRSGLPTATLIQIWKLADADADDRLNLQE